MKNRFDTYHIDNRDFLTDLYIVVKKKKEEILKHPFTEERARDFHKLSLK